MEYLTTIVHFWGTSLPKFGIKNKIEKFGRPFAFCDGKSSVAHQKSPKIYDDNERSFMFFLQQIETYENSLIYRG